MRCAGECAKADSNALSAETMEKTAKHPCYSYEGHLKYARMHIPVAPKCNISCNYCNRKYDCVNESRPGVTSEILSPAEACDKFVHVKDSITNLSVVGIAGPGDSLADWPRTKESIRLIKAKDPDAVFCLSTNGLMLPEYAEEIIKLGVHHITVTVNTIDPVTGAKIYKYINYKGQKYTGEEGSNILIKNQLAGISKLTENGALVKVNIVMINNVNDEQIPDVVRKVKELGVFITNIMPLIPAPGSAFEDYPQTSTKDVNKMRDLCEIDVQQMRHCKQCRADAIGMLQEDRSTEFRSYTQKEAVKIINPAKRYKIAVASRHGRLIDQHFGHAATFLIYQTDDGSTFNLVENRPVGQYCLGAEECGEEEDRREKMIRDLADCDAVLTMRIGYHAESRLSKQGILSVENCDSVENGLKLALQKLIFQESA